MLLPFMEAPRQNWLHLLCPGGRTEAEAGAEEQTDWEEDAGGSLGSVVVGDLFFISYFQSTQEKNRVSSDMNELRDHLDIKDRKISVLQRKVFIFLDVTVFSIWDPVRRSVKGLVKQPTYLFNDPSIDLRMQAFGLFKFFT